MNKFLFLFALPALANFGCAAQVQQTALEPVQQTVLSDAETSEGWDGGGSIKLIDEAKVGEHALRFAVAAGAATGPKLDLSALTSEVAKDRQLSFWYRLSGRGKTGLTVKLNFFPFADGWQAAWTVAQPAEADGQWHQVKLDLSSPYMKWGDKPDLTTKLLTFRTDAGQDSNLTLDIDQVVLGSAEEKPQEPTPVYSVATGALKVVQDRVIEDELKPNDAPKAEEVARLVSTLGADGRWPDIDYASQERVDWAPANHLKRLKTLARAYRLNADKPDAAAQNGPLKNAILRGYDSWFVKRPISTNWWWQPEGIGTHLVLAPTMLMMRDELSPAQLAAGVGELKGAWWGIGKGGGENKGQNLVWRGRIALMRAALTGDEALAREAMRGVTSVIAVTSEEGLQADWSFHQHGPQLYSGGYGQGFTSDMGDLVALTAGTGLALPPQDAAVLERYVLDGQQWMIRGKYFDYSVVGREIARKGKDAGGLIGPIAKLAQLNGARSAELLAMSKRMKQGPTAANPHPTGNRAFWRSDYMAQQKPDYLTSVRMSSVRTRATEITNGEGLLSYYLGDGANLIYRRGDEYQDIFAVWDWTRIPGVTSEMAAAPPPITGEQRGTTEFVGVVSDGTSGVAALDYERAGVTARKSWFLFDGLTVAVGAGINGTGPNMVATSINQTRLNGAVTVNANGKNSRPAKGEHRLSGTSWVFHDGVGYLFPDRNQKAAKVVMKNQAQTGKWSLINASGSKDTVAMDVFSLWIEQGVKPRNATYEYVVAPTVALDAMPEFAANLPVKVASNTPACQAVWHEGQKRGGIAFFAAGSCVIRAGLRVTVSAPCLVMLHDEGGALTIGVSDPTQKLASVQVDVGAHLSGAGAVWMPDQKVTRLKVTLPTGERAGQSVVQSLKIEQR